MRKPSIFSRDYEKIMRKRKRIFTSVISALTLSVIFLVLFISKYKIGNIEGYLMTWIKNDDSEIEEQINDDISNIEIEDSKLDENIEEDNSVKLSLGNEELIMRYSYIDGKKSIESVDTENGEYYSINKSRNKIIILDNEQNIFLGDVEGNVINITLNEYISPYGEVFNKNNVLEIYDEYIWHLEPRFLGENKIAYISNLPYFGYGLSKYINVVELETGIHTTMWGLKGNNIILKETLNHGLEAEIDGNIKYVE